MAAKYKYGDTVRIIQGEVKSPQTVDKQYIGKRGVVIEVRKAVSRPRQVALPAVHRIRLENNGRIIEVPENWLEPTY